MLFRQIFDDKLAQYAYLVGCQQTKDALLIDPERDVDRYVALVEAEGLRLTAVAETHIHADFLSGARELAERLPGLRLYLSDEGGPDWRYAWAAAYEGRVRLLRDGDTFAVGKVEVQALHTPGHTPEHLSFLITDRGAGADAPLGLASGDFVFVGDLGRPDLLETVAGQHGTREASARRLYASVPRFLDLPDFLQVWPGHGAGSACGKALGAVPESTVGYERRFNAALRAARDGEEAFVEAILGGQPEPPLYFARMKRLNRDGVPVLGALPQPRRLTAPELSALAGRRDVAVLDTRPERSLFMAGHLPGALFAPLDKSFPTVAGSYADPEQPLYLVAEAARVEEAVRALVRVGLDHVAGFATPETVAHLHEADDGPAFAAIPEITFDEVAARRAEPGVVVLDVRRQDEYDAGHVPGALHAPHARLPEHLARLPAGHTLLVYCASGIRSAVASALLARHGFDVCYVNDLFARWAQREAVVQAG